jgi:hypothetical protein
VSTYEHELELLHRRRAIYSSLDERGADSRTEVHASSTDLVESVKEMLSRLPNDVYGAFREALNGIEHPPLRAREIDRPDAR